MIDILVGIGLSAAFMAVENTHCPTCENYTQNRLFAEPSLSVEARSDQFGLMVSYGQSEFDSHAYKALDRDGTVKTIQQTINTHWIGLQGTWTHPTGLRLMGGLTQIWGENYERGTYNENCVSHRNETSELRPMFGIGFEKPLSQNWRVKAEWEHIGHAVESIWTLHSNIDTLAFQIVRRF
jgi:hypothetical protein